MRKGGKVEDEEEEEEEEHLAPLRALVEGGEELVDGGGVHLYERLARARGLVYLAQRRHRVCHHLATNISWQQIHRRDC